MTRITMLHVDLPPSAGGGVAAQVAKLSEVLVARGHEVTVRTLTEGPPDAPYDVDVVNFPAVAKRSKVGILFGTPLAFATGNYREADIVHAHGDSQLLVRRRTPVVRTFYGSAREEAQYSERLPRRVSQYGLVPAERLAKRLATVTVGISQNTSQSIGRLDVIIPCGVDRSGFEPGKKSHHPSVLFVGTLDGRKRGRLLLRTFERSILPRVPECELWVVSKDRAEGRNVHWFGRVDEPELRRLFASAWTFCLPSSYEGFGVPYIEAMASGTAVVATPNSGANEIIVPDSGGILVGDRELGHAVASLLLDAPRRCTLEHQGRTYSERFDWSHVAAAYEDTYELAIGQLRRKVHRRHSSPDAEYPQRRAY